MTDESDSIFPVRSADGACGAGPPARTTRRFLIEVLLLAALFVYSGVLWIWGAGRADIHNAMEAMRAVSTRNMMRTGDYVVPRLGVRPYLAKPPLFYWAAAAASRLTGGRVTESSVRLASAVFGMLALLVLYFAVRPVFGWATAAVAAVAGATTPLIFSNATSGDVNMLLGFCVAVSIFSAFYMLEAGRHAWFYALICGAGLALGLLTKGQVEPLFLVPTILLYVGFEQRGRLTADWRRWVPYMAAIAFFLWLAMAIIMNTKGSRTPALSAVVAVLYGFAVVTLLYFALRNQGYKKLLSWPWLIVLAAAALLVVPWAVLVVRDLTLPVALSILKTESVEKLAGEVGKTNINPPWFYLRTFPPAVLPYILFVPLAFLSGHGAGASDRRRRMLLLARCWLAGSFVLFSVGSEGKGVRYLLPAFPAIAILAADVMVRGFRQELRPWVNTYVRWLARWSVRALYLVPPACLAACLVLKLPAALAASSAVAAAAGAGIGAYLHERRRLAWAPLVAFALVMIGPKMIYHLGRSEILNRTQSSRPQCELIRKQVPTGETLYVYGSDRGGMHPVNVFYLDGIPFETYESDQVWLAGHSRLFVCMDGKRLDSFKAPPGFRQTETVRVPADKDVLVLLRLDLTTRSFD